MARAKAPDPQPPPKAPEPASQPVGIVCPRCECRHFEVVYTRPKGNRIMRRKECRYCGHRITTWEQS